METRPPTWDAVKRLVDEAATLDPEARADFVDTVCADDSSLRTYISPLLDLESTSPAGLGEAAAAGLRWEGTRLGPYRILEELGHGGMGAVFRAERVDGEFEQEVAIKVVNRGPLTAELRTRFLVERQVLARLIHPNIARLLDGGTTDDGIPYLVLELIDGEQITTYCRRRQLPIAERLELMIQVCRGVEHAHRNLVVHRDLKPGNILVRSDGRAKLLDFGIAKLIDDAADSGLTRMGERPGTLGYASPEQLLGEPITTSSDVYSLGIVLYQMLTLKRPFGDGDDRWQSIARLLQGEKLPAPSQAAREATGDTVAGLTWRYLTRPFRRQSSPARELEGDLDRIVMRAIERQPEKRYGSAADLADDLERYLRHEPVSAAPASLGYLAGKLIRRHRGPALALFLIILTLIGGLVARSLEASRANRERAIAQEERTQAEALASFMLQDLWEGLQAEGQLSLLSPVAQRLREYYSARASEGRSFEDRWRHAEALSAVGSVLHEAGQLENAKQAYSERLALLREISTDPPDKKTVSARVETLHELAGLHRDSLSTERSLELLQEALEEAESWLEDHPEDFEFAEAVAINYDLRGISLYDQGALDKAMVAFDQAHHRLQLPPLRENQGADILDLSQMVETHRGVVFKDLGKLEEARTALEHAVELAELAWRKEPADLAKFRGLVFARTILAGVLVELNRPQEAQDLLEPSRVAVREAVARNPRSAENRYLLTDILLTFASIAEHQGQEQARVEALEEVVKAAEPMVDQGNHVYLADSYVRALLGLGKIEQAKPHALELLSQDWEHQDFQELCERYGIGLEGSGG